MANSYRKTPIIGMTTAHSDKQFKAKEHRRERVAVRIALQQRRDAPDPRHFGDPCLGEKDGKQYYTGNPALLRK